MSETLTMICAGRRLRQNGQLNYAWIDEADPTADERWYGPKFRGRPGERVEVEVGDKPGSVLPSTAHYLGRIDDERIAEWTVTDRHVAVEHEATSARKRDAKSDDSLDELLAPLRERYRSTIGHSRRAALLALIIEAVTG